MGLAILMAGGLVLFGIGSNVNGGLANVFGGGDATSAAKDSVETDAEQVQADPKNEKALAGPDRRALHARRRPGELQPGTGEFTDRGQGSSSNLLKEDWADYLKLTDDKPISRPPTTPSVASSDSQDAKGATQAQQIITEKQPNAANYLALMLYASYAGDSSSPQAPRSRQKDLRPRTRRRTSHAQIKEIKKQVGERNDEVQKQIQEQFAQQAAGRAAAVPRPIRSAESAALAHEPPALQRASSFRSVPFLFSGPVAQLAEQGTLNPKVEGSIPSWPISRAELTRLSCVVRRLTTDWSLRRLPPCQTATQPAK